MPCMGCLRPGFMEGTPLQIRRFCGFGEGPGVRIFRGGCAIDPDSYLTLVH